jgi:hypothetical protein
MPRLLLQAKLPEHKIKRLEQRGDHSYIAINDPLNFNLLKDNRCEDEKFSRVDKFHVNHYYQVGTEWLYEKIFYPSNEGFEEINLEKKHPFKKQYERLIKQGIGLQGERPIPKIDKPIKRVELKAKSKRINLTCKEE